MILQISDLVRSQNMAMQQGQQQLNQQQYAQFGPGPIPNTTQRQPFHDQPPTQQSQPHMPTNFTGMTNMQNAQMRGTMMRPFIGNPGAPLDMLARFQQQPQNGSMGLAAARMVQQQQQQQQANISSQPGQNPQAQSEFFNPSDNIHTSPARSAAQPARANGDPPLQIHSAIQSIPDSRRHMTFHELKGRAMQVRSSLQHHEGLLQKLHNERAGMTDHDYRGKVNTLQNDVRGRKDILQKILSAMAQMQQQGIPPHPNEVTGGPPGSPGNM
jgi:hypothetical protein